MKNILWILCVLSIQNGLWAQDLETLISLGLENNPEIKQYHIQYEIANEKVNEVNTIPNTEFSYGYFISEPETRTGAQKMKFSLKQMIPWFGSITARENYINSMSDAKYEEIAVAQRKLIVSISNAYYNMYDLQSKDLVIQQNIDLLKVYETMALNAVETGKASAVSVLRLQMRKNDLTELKGVLHQKYLSQQAALNSLLNRDLSVAVVLIDDLPMPEHDFDVMASDLEMHPELLKYDKLYASVVQSELLNQKEKSPMIGFGIDYIPVEKRPDMDFADNGKDIFMPMVSLSIPIFNKKYKSNSKQNELKQLEIDAQKQSQFNKLQQLMDEAINERMASRLSYDTQLKNLEQAENAKSILLKSYESGNIDFNDVLDIQELQLKFQMGLINAIRNYYRQTTMINYLSK
ncbi:TolC family protein [Lutimonas vermicola]|uniref:TolC family protein n=1 Tax=Lutimonas vermicola TaxID=414288 RepID=A0ABU9KXH9_9FLAO